jgi:hypothetical protein
VFCTRWFALLYDAPWKTLPVTGMHATSARRVLWLVPMLRVPTTAVASADVRRRKKAIEVLRDGSSQWQDIEILGIFSPAAMTLPSQARMERKQRTHYLETLHGSARARHASTLAVWRMPADARGDWHCAFPLPDPAATVPKARFPVTLPLPQMRLPAKWLRLFSRARNPALPEVQLPLRKRRLPHHVTSCPAANRHSTRSSPSPSTNSRTSSCTQTRSQKRLQNRSAPPPLRRSAPLLRTFEPSKRS